MVVSKRATNYLFVTARWTFPGKLYMANCSVINLTVWEQHYVWRKDLGQACTSMFHSIFAVVKKDWSVLLWLFSHQSSTEKMNCCTSLPFCSISYNGYCIFHWKILKNLSLRETSVYLWYSHIKSSYFFLKVRILHLWFHSNKQTILKGGEGESNRWLDK